MKKQTNGQAVLYLRVASADLLDQQTGIAQQRAVCRREAERLGVAITDEYIDVAASGNDSGRSGLRHLLSSIARRPVKYVIASDRARLARNPIDASEINQDIEESGASIVLANECGMSSVVLAGLGRSR